VTPEELTAGHAKQLDALVSLLTSPERFWCWYTSRRAGKTSNVAFAHLLTALANDNQNCIYAALTRGQAKEAVWRTIWLPLLDRLEIKHKSNQTHQQTIFENGSSVVFGGLDDLRHIQTYLGNRVDLFTADEAQSAASSLLRNLFEVVLLPAISDKAHGKFLFSGTIPEVAGGYFYEVITGGKWSVKNWSRWDNPHLENQQKALSDTLRISGLDVGDPLIRRDWFGELVFDPKGTVFRYSRERCGYEGAPPLGLSLCAAGIDPGTRDRTAIEVWAWDPQTSDLVWHVDEWCTERNSGTSWAEIGAQLKAFNQKRRLTFPPYYDAGGSQMTIDTFTLDYGIPVVLAAEKKDMPGQVARFADLLGQGRAKIRIGSALETDLVNARWDGDARQEGRYKWSSHIHPDAADAARYGLQAYFNARKELEDKRTPQERLRDAERDRIREAIARGHAEVGSASDLTEALRGACGFDDMQDRG